MPCPFRHKGEPEPVVYERRKPLDRVKDWYVRDINISRRIGWKHGPPPEFVQRIYEFVNEQLFKFETPEKVDAMDMGLRFQVFLEKLVESPALAQKITFPPLLNQSLFEGPLEPVGHGKVPQWAPLEQGLTTMLGDGPPGPAFQPPAFSTRDPGAPVNSQRLFTPDTSS